MALRMVVCPTCDYTGAGSASMKGPTSAAGMCPDCLGRGEVTVEKRERLLVKAAAATAERVDRLRAQAARLHAIADGLEHDAEHHNPVAGYVTPAEHRGICLRQAALYRQQAVDAEARAADELIEQQRQPASCRPSMLCCPDWPILHAHARSCRAGGR